MYKCTYVHMYIYTYIQCTYIHIYIYTKPSPVALYTRTLRLMLCSIRAMSLQTKKNRDLAALQGVPRGHLPKILVSERFKREVLQKTTLLDTILETLVPRGNPRGDLPVVLFISLHFSSFLCISQPLHFS